MRSLAIITNSPYQTLQIWASLIPKTTEKTNFNFLSWLSMAGIAMEHFLWTKENQACATERNSTLGLLTVYPVKSGSFPLLIFLTGKFKNGRKNATLCISLCILSVICLYLLKGALSNLVTGNFLFNPKLGQFREKLFSKKFHLFDNRLWIPKT